MVTQISIPYKIIITDSGLGGISFMALLERKLKEKSAFKEVELIYFNAQPGDNLGYNDFYSSEKKIRVFDRALSAMGSLNPDLIIIACNTLSVLYSETNFSKKGNIPVVEILTAGVDQMLNSVSENDKLLIFGTQTTIESGKHAQKLVAQSVEEARIAGISCPGLQCSIERGPESEDVKSKIMEAVREAELYVKKDERIIASLCCTHFSFSESVFDENLEKRFGNNFRILNPNNYLIHKVLMTIGVGEFIPVIRTKMFTQVIIERGIVAALAGYIPEEASGTRFMLESKNGPTSLFEIA